MLTESLLNLVWLVIAVTASAGVLSRRRDPRTIAALLGALVLLFPIISISDDFSADKTLEEAVAVLTILIGAVALIALFRLATAPRLAVAVHRVVLSDPRSPPRG
jgi:Na+/H+ antiporter NhaD/arsenite permease-like protein